VYKEIAATRGGLTKHIATEASGSSPWPDTWCLAPSVDSESWSMLPLDNPWAEQQRAWKNWGILFKRLQLLIRLRPLWGSLGNYLNQYRKIV
jgi:hypothetical protein